MTKKNLRLRKGKNWLLLRKLSKRKLWRHQQLRKAQIQLPTIWPTPWKSRVKTRYLRSLWSFLLEVRSLFFLNYSSFFFLNRRTHTLKQSLSHHFLINFAENAQMGLPSWLWYHPKTIYRTTTQQHHQSAKFEHSLPEWQLLHWALLRSRAEQKPSEARCFQQSTEINIWRSTLTTAEA